MNVEGDEGRMDAPGLYVALVYAVGEVPSNWADGSLTELECLVGARCAVCEFSDTCARPARRWVAQRSRSTARVIG